MGLCAKAFKYLILPIAINLAVMFPCYGLGSVTEIQRPGLAFLSGTAELIAEIDQRVTS